MPKATPSLTITPDPVPVGTTSLIVNGAGFKAGETATIDFSHGGAESKEIVADAGGKFVYTHTYTWLSAGNAGVSAWVLRRRQFVNVASYAFKVVA